MENQYVGRKEHEEFAHRMEDEHHRLNARIKDLSGEMDKAHKAMNDRIKEVEGKTDTLTQLTASVESIAESVKTLTERVKSLERQPAENWNAVVKAALTAIGSALGGGLVGVLAAQLIK